MSSSNKSNAVGSVTVSQKTIGMKEAIALLGWRDAKADEVGYPYVGPKGKGRFVLANNKSNRPFKRQLAEQYKQQFLRGEWAGQWNSPSKTHNGEPFIVDSEGSVVSFAHRGVGLILAELERQRLVEFSDGPNSPAAKKLDEHGCRASITIDVVLVEGVDPKSADTVDIGRTRTHGDVKFRRHEFRGTDTSSKVEARLSKELSHAERLVWLRLKGLQVSRGPKCEIPELLSFGERHPLMRDALLYVYKMDGGAAKDGRKISNFIPLGYAAALMYLAAFSKSNREAYETGTLDMTKKPKRWEKAAEFWRLFSKDLHSQENGIKSLHTILGKDRQKKDSKFSRDTKCSLVARAFRSWIGESKSWSTELELLKSLESNDSEVQRFGGLDLKRADLQKLGIIEEERPIVRSRSGEWKVGQSTLVVGSEFDPWVGTIESFSDDGQAARVIDGNDEYVDCKIEWLESETPKQRAA